MASKKRQCGKGIPCGYTCITSKKRCQKNLLGSVSSSLAKVSDMLNPKQEVNEDWFKKGTFKTFKKPAREPFEVAKKDGVIQTLEGPVSYKKGFYIMTGPKGEKYPVEPGSFAKLKVDNGDGTASPRKIVKLAKLADHSGAVKTSWGETLSYSPGEDVIVRHGPGDYGVVKKDIFDQTYGVEK